MDSTPQGCPGFATDYLGEGACSPRCDRPPETSVLIKGQMFEKRVTKNGLKKKKKKKKPLQALPLPYNLMLLGLDLFLNLGPKS